MSEPATTHQAVKSDWWDHIVGLSKSRGAGFFLFAVTAAAFLVLAVLVAAHTPWITRLDVAVQEETFDLRSPWVNDVTVWVTRLGSRWLIGSLLLLLSVWVMRTGRCRKALLVMLIAFLANPLVEYFLKTAVDRPRPDLSRLVPGNGPSFPSGHVLASVGFYGVLAAVAWRSSHRRTTRIAAYAAATVVIVAVGFSRVFLGVHWFTDVIGGMLAGTAFVLAVAWSLQGHHLGRDLGCEIREGSGDRPRHGGPAAP